MTCVKRLDRVTHKLWTTNPKLMPNYWKVCPDWWGSKSSRQARLVTCSVCLDEIRRRRDKDWIQKGEGEK